MLPRGEKIPEGIESRTIGVVDVRETETMKMANHRIIIPVESDSELLNTLTSELSGTTSITGPVLGIPVVELLGLVRGLQKSDCTVIFYGSGIINSGHTNENLSAIAGLVKALRNNGKEAYAMPMFPERNTMGAVITANEVASSPGSIDYSNDEPVTTPGFTALQKLATREFKVALIAGDDVLAMLPGPAAKALAQTQLVYIGPPGGLTDKRAAVSIHTPDILIMGSRTMTRLDMIQVEFKPWPDEHVEPIGMTEVLIKLREIIQKRTTGK